MIPLDQRSGTLTCIVHLPGSTRAPKFDGLSPTFSVYSNALRADIFDESRGCGKCATFARISLVHAEVEQIAFSPSFSYN